ncbi:MauE/DoxX family redox-associated membrane protein [Paenibacillus sp. Leaf72]|uniref:MauE/DoxX family redox-associated membrane protein n=1 Tax=Paenibacillus sp. Leaf72 TaxID=1736234 RepID=UPI000B3282DF|nr:MauE/DoxX family redox-associated membrane protein [Paenibacillus sp. Leaf72]
MDYIFILEVFCFIVFIFSGISKIVSKEEFGKTVSSLLESKKLVRITVIVVPFFEIVAAALMLFADTKWISKILILGLLGAFLVASFIAISKKRSVSCNCFGNLIPEKLGYDSFYKISFLIIVDAFLMLDTSNYTLLNGPIENIVVSVIVSTVVLVVYGIYKNLIALNEIKL